MELIKEKIKKLAKIVQEAIFEQNIDTRDRGIRKSDFLVLRENPAPAILIELGFRFNKSDEKRMNSEEFQEKSKKGIVDEMVLLLILPSRKISKLKNTILSKS